MSIAFAAIGAFAPGLAQAQGVTLDSDDPVLLFNRGNELFDAEKYADAYAFYEKSFRIKPSYDSGGNAATCAHKLGHYAEAARLFHYSLDHIPSSLEASKRGAAEERLRELLADSVSHVAVLALELAPKGAELLVDDTSAGFAPIEGELYLAPGKHTLAARLSGHRAHEQALDVKAGDALALKVSLEVASDGRAAPVSGPDAAVVVGGAVGGAAFLATGIGLIVAAGGKSRSREDLGASLAGVNPCGEGSPYPSECTEIRALSADERTFRAVGIAGVALGGATWVATLAYALWPRDPSEGVAGTNVTEGASGAPSVLPVVVIPDVSPVGAALSLWGTF